MSASTGGLRILLTGGRAPVALELARLLHRAGHRIFSAESLRPNLLHGSCAIEKHYHLPSPRFAFSAYQERMLALIEREKIDLLIPTCEELFYVARLKESVPPTCRVFTDSFARVDALHNKWTFARKASEYGLAMPATRLLTTRDDYCAALHSATPLVLKPVYSRFGLRTIMPFANQGRIPACVPYLPGAWVAQEYVDGRQLCTFSIANAGQLLAHAAYPSVYRWGLGSTIYFTAVDHAAALLWVEAFVAREHFTGQIAFDFIEDVTGAVQAIECNPRATSGIHLFRSQPDFTRAYTEGTTALITPAPQPNPMISTAMLLHALTRIRTKRAALDWLASFRGGQDVIFSASDPLPTVQQFVSLATLVARARRLGISGTAATTHDIEYNGEVSA